MGASSSTEQVPVEQREAESLAASTGALPMLQKAFSALADPQTTNTIPIHSLQQCFSLSFEIPTCEAAPIPPNFEGFLSHVGPSLVDLFFMAEKGGVTWIEFLKGYVKCCGRMSVSTLLNTLFRVFAMAAVKAGLPAKLQFESDDADCKMSGFLVPADVLMLLWMCYIMSWSSKILDFSGWKGDRGLPDLSHLVLSAVLSCGEVGSDFNPWACDILSMDVQLPAAKIQMWVLKTLPNLPDCFTQYVHGRIEKSFTSENKLEPSCSAVRDLSSGVKRGNNLLTQGRAWAISLTLRSTLNREILKACFPSCDGNTDSLLYRSSLHGKGLNRFWSKVEGYNGPMLILVAASLGDVHDDNGNVRRFILGVITHQAFENRDMFYGSSGSLYAISPVFNVFLSSGKEKNFVYSHLHPTGKVYDPRPKPVGLAFGGSIGNERIFIDEDFAKVTVRHHAVDKTYQSGPLFPSQGFLPVEALILDVEVSGLAGITAKEMQTSYRKREELFTEQRRKVDLKTFSSWEDSPEKMMMDMVSDPNGVKREDR